MTKSRPILRRALLTFGWLSIIGSIGDAVILAYHISLTAVGEAALMASVWEHISDHLSFLAWLRPLAAAILPPKVVDFLFGLPAVNYFPVRIVFSVVTGGLALRWAERLKQRSRG